MHGHSARRGLRPRQARRPVRGHVIDASTCDPVKKLRELTDGRGVDAIDECSGNPAIVDTLKFYLRGGGWERGESAGRIHLQGDYPKPIMLSSYNDWFCTNGTITMSCALQPGDKTDILKFMAEGKFKCGWNEPKSVEDAPALYKEIDRNYFEFLKPILKWK
jgi:threonine dehydrogenase-like Zn-dependent dehydrogenase